MKGIICKNKFTKIFPDHRDYNLADLAYLADFAD
jgi:tetraacyldisaccharide-1-P 4'-kinase